MLSFSSFTINTIYAVDTPVPNTIYSVNYSFFKTASGYTEGISNTFMPDGFGVTPTVYSAITPTGIFNWITGSTGIITSGNTFLESIEEELDRKIINKVNNITTNRIV